MKEENIKNLTSLWLLAGKAFNANQTVSSFEVVNIPFSEWPNRIWSVRQMTPEKKNVLKEIMLKNNPAMTFSEWRDLNESENVDNYDMKIKSVQVGMSLRLADYKPHLINNPVNLIRVHNNASAKLWSKLFLQSFGYLISNKIVDEMRGQVEFYNLEYENHFVGTIATYKLENSIGIHSLGITGLFRKRGLAEKAMRIVVEKARQENCDYAHLQSSAMGINIYKKLGFSEIFKMYNYVLK